MKELVSLLESTFPTTASPRRPQHQFRATREKKIIDWRVDRYRSNQIRADTKGRQQCKQTERGRSSRTVLSVPNGAAAPLSVGAL